MTRILLGPYSRSGSGIATYLIELAKALKSINIDVMIFGFEPAPSIAKPGEWIKIGKDVGPGIAFFPLQIYLTERTAKILEKLAREIDALHVVSASIAAKIKTDFILTAWSLMSDIRDMRLTVRLYNFPMSWLSPIAFSQALLINKLSYMRAKKIICVTTKLNELLVKSFGPAKVTYIPPGIKIDKVPKQLKEEEIHIFYVSRDIGLPRKNFKTFLKALMILDRFCSKNKVNIHIVGKAKEIYLSQIKSVRNIKVFIHGYIDRSQLLNLYSIQAPIIYVSTSIYEEFNYSLLEALAKGAVAVASNIDAHRDFIIDGQTGFLYNPYSEKELVIKLCNLIKDIDLYNRLRKSSVEFVRKRFDWEIILPRILKLYMD